MANKILYFDMDNVLVDFEHGIREMRRISPKLISQYEGRLDEVPGIFGLMIPIPGAIEAYNELSEIFDTYILSTAPWLNSSAWSDKNRWVRRYLGEVARKRLTISHNKHLSRGHFLVDDRPNNGADRFEEMNPDGEWIHFGTEQFPNWEVVTAYLKQKA